MSERRLLDELIQGFDDAMTKKDCDLRAARAVLMLIVVMALLLFASYYTLAR